MKQMGEIIADLNRKSQVPRTWLFDSDPTQVNRMEAPENYTNSVLLQPHALALRPVGYCLWFS
jgi:hypothetical protein